jgi:hypothetical protein
MLAINLNSADQLSSATSADHRPLTRSASLQPPKLSITIRPIY